MFYWIKTKMLLPIHAKVKAGGNPINEISSLKSLILSFNSLTGF